MATDPTPPPTDQNDGELSLSDAQNKLKQAEKTMAREQFIAGQDETVKTLELATHQAAIELEDANRTWDLSTSMRGTKEDVEARVSSALDEVAKQQAALDAAIIARDHAQSELTALDAAADARADAQAKHDAAERELELGRAKRDIAVATYLQEHPVD